MATVPLRRPGKSLKRPAQWRSPSPLTCPKPKSINELVGLFQSRFDRLDILINNAGLGTLATLQETSLTLWNRTLAINLTGPLLLTQLTSGHMIQQGWGRIVNIASTSGIRAGINRTAYGTSKLPSSGSPKWPSN
jgi:NAD(P)-dependent dehydrogenase (short-subunit alcohol dehydrogenase family)